VANVIWGLINLFVACIILFKTENFELGLTLNSLFLFLGLLIGAIYVAWNFTDNED